MISWTIPASFLDSFYLSFPLDNFLILVLGIYLFTFFFFVTLNFSHIHPTPSNNKNVMLSIKMVNIIMSVMSVMIRHVKRLELAMMRSMM